MAQKGICVRLGEMPDAPLCWWRVGEDTLHWCDTAQTLAEQCAGEPAVVLAPAFAFFNLQAEMPAMPAQRLSQALPYALEEQLAGDVEQMHFAHGQRNDEGLLPVLAIEHTLMGQWLETCEQAQLRPQAIYNEALSLPVEQGEWTLMLEAKGALLRTSKDQAYFLGADQWRELLVLAWEQRDATSVETVRVYDARGGEEQPGLPPLPGAQIEHQRCEQPLSLLCRGNASNPINLMQGPYSRKEKVGRLWAPWRATTALLLLVLGVNLATAVYDYFTLSSLDEELYQENAQLFKEAFPEARSTGDPRVRMERKLKALQGGGSSTFSVLMAGSGKALAATEGVTLTGLRYREGVLELELELNALPRLDALKASLESNPVNVEVRNATARGEKVEATIMVSEAGA